VIVNRLNSIPIIQTVEPAKGAPGAMRLEIPPGFSARYERSQPSVLIFEPDVSRASEAYVVRAILRELQARLDAGRTASHLAATQIIAYTGDVDLRQLRTEAMKGATSEEADAVEVVERQPHGVVALRSFDLQVPGLAVMFLLFGALSGVGRRMMEDRENGRLGRILLTPGGLTAALGGILIARAGIGILQMTALLSYGHLVLGVPLGTSPTTLAGVVTVMVGCAVCFGAMLGGIANSDEQLNALGIGTILTMSALGGCWWPLYLEPEWMQRLADLTITKWAMQLLTGVLLQGRGWRDVGSGIGWLTAFALTSFAVGLAGYRRRLFKE
jgi:ABC-type multidrug transport system permease subunit